MIPYKAAFGFLFAAVLCTAASDSDWHYFRGNPLHGQPTAMVMTLGRSGVFGIKCYKPGPNSLYLKWAGDRHSAVEDNAYEDRDFEWRFDNGEFQLAQWTYQRGTAFTADPSVVRIFLQGLATASVLTIREHGPDDRQTDATVGVSGARMAIEKIRVACLGVGPRKPSRP